MKRFGTITWRVSLWHLITLRKIHTHSRLYITYFIRFLFVEFIAIGVENDIRMFTKNLNRLRIAYKVTPPVTAIYPCCFCGAKPTAAFKIYTRKGMQYYLYFSNGCRLCRGKTGILQIFPLTYFERQLYSQFEEVSK